MMVFVALIAIGTFVGIELFQLSVRPMAVAYQKRALAHARLAEQWNDRAESTLSYFMAPSPSDNTPAFPWPGAKIMPKEYMREQAEYHAALKQKYADASRHPWVRVPPDPNPP
jgi:hypothetical protein